MAISLTSIASQVRKYAKANGLFIQVKVVGNYISITNAGFCGAAGLCAAATGLKFNYCGNDLASLCEVYSLDEIKKASLDLRLEKTVLNKDLEYIANWCWSYVNKFTDFSTSFGVKLAWEAAYVHVVNNDKYLQTNTLPN